MVSLMNKNLPQLHHISGSDIADQSLDEISTKRKSRIVSRFLSPALQFWLKSQSIIEAIEAATKTYASVGVPTNKDTIKAVDGHFSESNLYIWRVVSNFRPP